MHKLFKASLGLVGLSYLDASIFFSKKIGKNISEYSLKNMAAGRTEIPDELWELLKSIYATQVSASESTLDLIGETYTDGSDIMLTLDGEEVKDLPTQGCHYRALAMVFLAK